MDKMYTKSGDTGYTDIFNQRVKKDNLLIYVVGEIDELNAYLGSCVFYGKKESHQDLIKLIDAIQEELYRISAEIIDIEGIYVEKMDAAKIEELEKQIDDYTDKELKPITNFLKQQGTEFSCHVNIARTICRRVERNMVSLNDVYPERYTFILKYFNRLSDLLFTLWRVINSRAKILEFKF